MISAARAEELGQGFFSSIPTQVGTAAGKTSRIYENPEHIPSYRTLCIHSLTYELLVLLNTITATADIPTYVSILTLDGLLAIISCTAMHLPLSE